MSGVDTALLRSYVELRQRQKERTAQADAIKAEANEVEKELLEQFGNEGTDSMRITMPDGSKRTVYLHRQLWARVEEGVDRAAICHAFQEIGLDQFVSESFNSQTVSSWMRDLEREGEDLPGELKGLLTGVEVFQVRDRKA